MLVYVQIKFSISEVPLLFWSFFLIFSTWLWGTLHLAFGYMWLLVLFIVFNFCQVQLTPSLCCDLSRQVLEICW